MTKTHILILILAAFATVCWLTSCASFEIDTKWGKVTFSDGKTVK